MPAAPAALALSPGEVSLSGWFGCRVNAGGLALPGSGASGQKEGWHLHLQAQAGALVPESKGGGVIPCFMLGWHEERGSERVQQPRWA